MKQKFLSILIICSLLFGTIFTNAVSVEFEDIIQNDEIEESKNLVYESNILDNEEILYIENSSKAKEQNINTDEMLIGHFTEASDILRIGESNFRYPYGWFYENKSIDSSIYVVYSNAVILNNGDKYDLVIYPFAITGNACIDLNSLIPALRVLPEGGYSGYKLVITEHGNINNTIDMNVLFGFSDLDNTEYAILPFNFSTIHCGESLSKEEYSNPSGIKYTGLTASNTEDEAYNKNCVFGELPITKDGTIVYYGYIGSCRTLLAFDKIQEYISQKAYTIQFSLNGGNGRVPTSIIKYGDNTSTLVGNIKNEIPIREGYTFKGWSAVPQLNEKRVAYDIGNTGATQTSSSWTYEDYCNYTGGNPSNRTLTLYAQWEVNQYPVTYVDIDENGNEIGRTTKLVDYDALVKGSDIGDDKTDNAYYPQYRYVSDTSEKVTTNGAVVYRVFEFCETEAKSNLQWNDNNNADGFRPDKYKLKLKQNGKIIDEIELLSDTTNYTFPNLPKYDENGTPYQYTFDVDASERYNIRFDDNGNLIVEDYLPANFSVIIPKQIVLDGNTGKADYQITVNGVFYYNDTLTVQPENNLELTDRSNLQTLDANIFLNKTTFTKKDNVLEGSNSLGSIQTEKIIFPGSWSGSFNFDIKFVMKN